MSEHEGDKPANGQNGQNIITHLLLTIIGGEYPGLMWLEHPNAV